MPKVTWPVVVKGEGRAGARFVSESPQTCRSRVQIVLNSPFGQSWKRN